MCKKLYGLALVVLAAALIACCPPAVQAGFEGGPSPALVTVAEAKALPDDAWVTLQGYIERHIRKDLYLFRDETGTITVDIDDDEWDGFVVKPTDKIEICGEVDKDFTSIEIDVERIRIISQ